MKASVVLCTYNRVELLKGSLKALLNLRFQDFEVIVVNDGSMDGTSEFLLSVDSGKLTVVNHEKNLGLSVARNSGINQVSSQSEIIAFTDDDCLVKPDWLDKLTECFERDNVDFVIGRTYYVSEKNCGFFPERIVQNATDNWPMGCNVAYKRKVFDEIGYFDDEYFRYGNEDTEMAIRAVDVGMKFSVASEAIVFHQKTCWNAPSLLRSAKNASVWVKLAKRYPENCKYLGSPIKSGRIICPKDYLILILWPIIVPILLARYWINGKRDVKMFFLKWPIFFFLRRYYIWREAVENRFFVI